MNSITRRRLLRTVAIAPLAAALASCTGADGQTPIARTIELVSLIAGGLASTVLPSLGSLAGLDAATVTKVQGWIAQLQKLASTAANVITNADAVSLASQVQTLVNAVIEALSNLSVLPANVSGALSAAASLIPVIFSILGMFAAPRSAPRFAGYRRMNEAEARAALARR